MELVKMEHPANMLAQSLDEALDNGVVSENGFVSVALAGEQLRRMLPMQDGDVSEAERVLARYDAFLAGCSGPMPDGLEADLGAAFEELERLAGDEQQEGEDLENALVHVEDVLAVAAARWRAGKLKTSTVVDLGREAARRAATLVPSLSAVWDLADRASLCFAPDPDLPDLYAFWDEVARFSHERLLFEEVLVAPSAELRSRVVAAAVERIMGAGEVAAESVAEPEKDIWSLVAEAWRKVAAEIMGKMPSPSPAPAFEFLAGMFGGIAGLLGSGVVGAVPISASASSAKSPPEAVTWRGHGDEWEATIRPDPKAGSFRVRIVKAPGVRWVVLHGAIVPLERKGGQWVADVPAAKLSGASKEIPVLALVFDDGRITFGVPKN